MDTPIAAPLVFFLSPRSSYRDVILSPHEIFCGPDVEDQQSDGRWTCVKTPAQAFDAKDFLTQKGFLREPEVILVKADATGRNFPRNLGQFKCPKVLLVGVTHFLAHPIRRVIEYAKSEPFDFILMDVTRHHAHWFREAGLKNVHWLPALEYHARIRPIQRRPARPLTFVGQAGGHHPFRKFILDKLRSDGLPLEVLQAPQGRAADIYSDSLVTLNITLNGDINMRFFEGLAAGGFLLCDRLPDATGLSRLFTEGKHFEMFGGYGELVEKIKYAFTKPEWVHGIKTAGHAWLMAHHSPDIKRKEFYDLVFRGVENPVYALEERAPLAGWTGPDALRMLPAYEFIQELHRNSRAIVVYCKNTGHTGVRQWLDLPRVECRLWSDWEPDPPTAAGEADFPVERVFYVENPTDIPELRKMLERVEVRWIFAPGAETDCLVEWGFTVKEQGLFECTRAVRSRLRRALAHGGDAGREMLRPCVDLCLNDVEALEVADACMELGLPDHRKEALLRAVFLNRGCVAALIQLAELSMEANALADAALLLSEANRVEPLPADVCATLEELLRLTQGNAEISAYLDAISGGRHDPPARTLRVLVITNLFPPQELGGYGRKIWEFSNGLRQRGHSISVLSSDAPYLHKAPESTEADLERFVSRSLHRMGDWKEGRTISKMNAAEQKTVGGKNAVLVLEQVDRFRPDVVLLGNLDFLGIELVHALLERGVPVVHSLGNQSPWYHPGQSIQSPLYAVAPASDWLGRNFLEQGYTAPRVETIYPGARVDVFYRAFLPDIRRLRIAFAGLVMGYKGPQVLIDALIKIQALGLDFEAEIAGDTTDPSFVQQLQEALRKHGLADRVHFLGFLSRSGLASLFARSNVLVFPTLVDEAFGISQVEAMASGLIVVTSGTGGTREVIRHEVDGLVFDAKDHTALAKCLVQIARDQALRNRLQAQARERALEFSVTSSVVKLEHLFMELLGKSGTQAASQAVPSPVATLEVAVCAFHAGRLTEAEDVCRELLQADEKCAEAWSLMARMAALNGDLEAAGDFGQVACELDPGNAAFVRFLGEVALQKGQLDSSEALARRVLEIAPDAVEGFVLLGRVFAGKGERDAALEAFQSALRMKKDHAEALAHYASALQKFGRGKDALSQIRKACALEPDSVEFQTSLAVLLEDNARYLDALAAFEKAKRLNERVAFVWYRLGRLLNRLKRHAEAEVALERCLTLPGSEGVFFYELGLAHQLQKHLPKALERYDQALAAGCNLSELHCNRGVVLKELLRYPEAIRSFHRAVSLVPDNVHYMNNLGAAALEVGFNTEALQCFQNAVERDPKLQTAHNNIGNLLKDRGCAAEALASYRRSMELAPGNRDTQSNFLLCHQYVPGLDPRAVFEAHKNWGLETSRRLRPRFRHDRWKPGERLRVGFLSADLCQHPVGAFLEPLLEHLDRARFEVHSYADNKNHDSVSARLRSKSDYWTETSDLSHETLAGKIHADGIDILFELAGHTALNRLDVFALSPAPVQASYLGYPSTTGLPAIGYRFTDAFADPPGLTEACHTETLVRIEECAWCYAGFPGAPEVAPLPALANNRITFGCFNNMAKLNLPLFEMWAEILRRVPTAHLKLKARSLIDAPVREEVVTFFTGRGISRDRLDFTGHAPRILEHLATYHQIDIALDSFPYQGTTTTCEALWMGVPVISLAGQTHVSRVGVSLLSNLGLAEHVAISPEAYIEKAVALASDSHALRQLRSGMRERMRSSPLMDAPGFARRFGDAIEQMLRLRTQR